MGENERGQVIRCERTLRASLMKEHEGLKLALRWEAEGPIWVLPFPLPKSVSEFF